ncbi:MAG: hypothetical protein U5J83_16770 [Bryobacterales bacterium]|nr:hypothetical protein [Bryobacterales bacterium]
MDERDFFIEARAQKTATLNCPFCRSANEYGLAWMVRKKRTNINLAQLDERDRAKFEKAQSYMVLLDDHATCLEPGCRRHFEVSGVKTMAFVTPEQLEEIDFSSQGRREGGYRQQSRGGGRRDDSGYRGQRGGQGGGQGGGQPNRGDYGNRSDSGNRGGYGNRDAQGGQGGRQQGAPGNRGGKQPNRGGGNTPPSPSPTQWNDQQGSRSPRGKRSDPTGPGGGWR